MLSEAVYRLNDRFNFMMEMNEKDQKRAEEIVEFSSKLIELSVKERIFKNLNPKQGEIWTVSFGANAGSEINRTRPALVIQSNKYTEGALTVVVVPITRTTARNDYYVEFTENDVIRAESYNDAPSGTLALDQIRCISKARLGQKVADLNPNKLEEVRSAFFNHLFLNESSETVK
ncbi:type II toxin-antitoxin system PemK/MazF family toxin [Lysinibacillus sp. UGB7]|uniref:type II toxin-antitoxin system PemK/MazF family toxin n=1 Tax=Lysinibacillus sp. UGB7 TaxID=3411039 RepID=UPI003B7871A9